MNKMDVNGWKYTLDEVLEDGAAREDKWNEGFELDVWLEEFDRRSREINKLRKRRLLRDEFSTDWNDPLFLEIKRLIYALSTGARFADCEINNDTFRNAVKSNKRLSDLWVDYVVGGGKALGLQICRLISANDSRLKVPEYMLADWETQKRLSKRGGGLGYSFLGRQRGRVFFRTSDHREDWLCGSSGDFGSSFDIPCNWLHPEQKHFIKEKLRYNPPIVLQEFMSDCVGIVVDFGWSELLQKNIARVATGRYGFEERTSPVHTSATRDVEGAYEAWCPEKKEIVIPRSGLGRWVKPHPGWVGFMDTRLGDMISALYEGLRDMGLDFGLEFELLVHHERPDVWHLVQVRPSPAKQRCGRLTPLTGDPLFSTPIINQSFDVRGEIFPSDDYERWREIRRKQEKDGYYEPFHEKRTIILWEREMLSDEGLNTMHSYYQGGAMGQIYPGAIYPNSKHNALDMPHRFKMSAEVFTEAQMLQIHPLLGLPQEQIDQLAKMAYGKPIKIRMVSDGLIGQIYLC